MSDMEEAITNYWLDQVASEIIAAHPSGEIVVESGHAPSGYYHIGTLREILTASAIAWRINEAGRRAKHIDFIDDFDAFRKVPAGVDESFRKYIGVPLYLVPDPTGKYGSWAEWLVTGLYAGLAELGVKSDVMHAHEEYSKGVFTNYIEQVLDKMPKAREIVADVTGRELPDDWSPFQILSDNNNLREWYYTGADQQRKVIYWQDRRGRSGEVKYDDGRVKLDWRFDWPARWVQLGIDAEPFGRDHATKGGSYDSGGRIIREIFGKEPPMPVPYDFINRVGETKKMSKSAGDVVTVTGALEIMPGEIIRYFVLRSMPSKRLFFDEGAGFVVLVDEYARTQEAVERGEKTEFEQAYKVASAQTKVKTISNVPFGHLVQCYQAAQRDINQTMELLERSGFGDAVSEQGEIIKRELKFIDTWLDKYAPERMKFEVQAELPKNIDLTSDQKELLAQVAEGIEKEPNLNGQGMHDLIYSVSEELELKPSKAFQAIYLAILGQDFGPKAGWFVAALDPKFVVTRFKEASAK
jgi:lysyl-tRNA synthetase class 1